MLPGTSSAKDTPFDVAAVTIRVECSDAHRLRPISIFLAGLERNSMFSIINTTVCSSETASSRSIMESVSS